MKVSDAANSTVVQRRVPVATSVSYVVILLDTSIVTVALDNISVSLATDIAGLQWVTNAYTLAFASLLLTGGTLGDRWGARSCQGSRDLREAAARRVFVFLECSFKSSLVIIISPIQLAIVYGRNNTMAPVRQ